MPTRTTFTPKLAVALTMLAVGLGAAGPAAASPVTRVIAPNGAGIECSVAVPCSYAYALTIGSNTGDTIKALPGTYDVSALPIDLDHRLTIVGDPALPRPVFTTSNPVQTTFRVEQAATGTVLRHLNIQAVGAFEGLLGYGTIDARDMVIAATYRCSVLYGDGSVLADSTLTAVPSGGSAPLCLDAQGHATLRGLTVSAPSGTGVLLQYGGSTFEDSSVTAAKPLHLSDGPDASTVRRVSLSGTVEGLWAVQGAAATVTDSVIATSGGATGVDAWYMTKLHLRNDTIVAQGATALGIQAAAASGSADAAKIDGRNLIVVAEGLDLVARVGGNPAACTPAPCAPGYLAIDHSAFSNTTGPVVNGGSNGSGDPLFADPGAGDFRLKPGSPAIDAGTPDALTGGIDRDGHARVQGAGIDMGAYELTPVPPAGGPVDPAAPSSLGSQPAAQPPVADLVAPTLSGVRVTNRVFAVGRGATAVSARTRRLGTTFRYSLSETATVRIDIARRGATKRFKHVATLSRMARIGANSTKLTGRIKRRALKPGAYRATFTARDSAGNASRRVVVKFTVVR